MGCGRGRGSEKVTNGLWEWETIGRGDEWTVRLGRNRER
jgi:hypothetical protein